MPIRFTSYIICNNSVELWFNSAHDAAYSVSDALDEYFDFTQLLAIPTHSLFLQYQHGFTFSKYVQNSWGSLKNSRVFKINFLVLALLTQQKHEMFIN